MLCKILILGLADDTHSLERIQQYLTIDQEPRPNSEGVPPASWPTSGDLEVQHLTARYSVVRSCLCVDNNSLNVRDTPVGWP